MEISAFEMKYRLLLFFISATNDGTNLPQSFCEVKYCHQVPTVTYYRDVPLVGWLADCPLAQYSVKSCESPEVGIKK